MAQIFHLPVRFTPGLEPGSQDLQAFSTSFLVFASKSRLRKGVKIFLEGAQTLCSNYFLWLGMLYALVYLTSNRFICGGINICALAISHYWQ